MLYAMRLLFTSFKMKGVMDVDKDNVLKPMQVAAILGLSKNTV